MPRSERLPVIKDRLAAGRLVNGRELARSLTVSVRTIYRDIAVLRSVGLRIIGEAGIGYMLRGQA